MLQQLKLFARKIHRLAATQDLVAAQEFSNRSEEHTSELQSQSNLVCRLLLEKKKFQPHGACRPWTCCPGAPSPHRPPALPGAAPENRPRPRWACPRCAHAAPPPPPRPPPRRGCP